jgi:hypothetical protein
VPCSPPAPPAAPADAPWGARPASSGAAAGGADPLLLRMASLASTLTADLEVEIEQADPASPGDAGDAGDARDAAAAAASCPLGAGDAALRRASLSQFVSAAAAAAAAAGACQTDGCGAAAGPWAGGAGAGCCQEGVEDEECGVCFEPLVSSPVVALRACGHRLCAACARGVVGGAAGGCGGGPAGGEGPEEEEGADDHTLCPSCPFCRALILGFAPVPAPAGARRPCSRTC